MIQRLNCNNFFTRYICEPTARDLSRQDKTIALIASIIIGVCTAWMFHAIVAIVRCRLDQRQIQLLPMPKSEFVIKTKSKKELFDRLEKDGPKATSLDLKCEPLEEDEILQVLDLCPTMRILAVKTDKLTKRLVRRIERMESLTELDIQLTGDARTSRSSIRSLREAPSLKRLSFQKVRSTERADEDEEPSPLHETPRELVELSLYSKEITSEELEEKISSSPNLEKLEFQIDEVSTGLAERIKDLQELRELGIDLMVTDTPVLSPEAFEILMKTPKLTHLYLKITEITPKIATKLCEAENLTSLSLELEKTISRGPANTIGKLEKLQKLSLNVMDWLQNQTFLTTVLTNLSRSKSIEELTLRRLQTLDRRDVASLKRMTSLTKLSLPSLKTIDSATLIALGDIPKLESLVLDAFRVQEDHRDAIKALEDKGIHVTVRK